MQNLNNLYIYRHLLQDEPLQKLLAYVNAPESNRDNVYSDFYFAVASAREKDDIWLLNAFQNHLLNLIIWDTNIFTTLAAQDASLVDNSLKNMVKKDLRILHEIFRLGDSLKIRFQNKLVHNPSISDIVAILLNSEDWTENIEDLQNHHGKYGYGITSRYNAFIWDGNTTMLKGIKEPDLVQFDNLVGYEEERKKVLVNTETFLNGYPAQHVLLYGDRGTGKSSTVKGLLTHFAPFNLKIVELYKNDINSLPILFEYLGKLPHKFIIFIDDLSFEDTEVEFKYLKAVLEGGLAKRPENVLLYATSNRRHLIKESLLERNADEIHGMDSVQEKMSLTDRFGLTITFLAPNQKEYLAIIDGLAEQRNIQINKELLHKLAIEWQLAHSGRSARVANQFIDSLESKLLLKQKLQTPN